MQDFDNGQNRQPIELLPSPWGTLREQGGNRWEPSAASDSTGEDQLAIAKVSRSQAEIARQKIANEILEATRAACKELIVDGERHLERAKYLEALAEQKHLEAEVELDYAQSIRAEAEAYREKVTAETQQQAQELLNRTRSTAERESLELKQQASLEAQRMLAQAENMRSAAREELEAQRLYSEAAKLKAESQEILVQVREKLDDPAAFLGANANGPEPTTFKTANKWPTTGQVESPTASGDDLNRSAGRSGAQEF